MPFCILLLFFQSPGFLAAEDPLSRSDELYAERRHEEAFELLLGALDDPAYSSETWAIYWRLARHSLDSGDERYEQGATAEELLTWYSRGEEYADQALRLNPDAWQGYFWKASSLARWAQAKGILNALFQAKTVRDLLSTVVRMYGDHGDTWYVLGILYQVLPGFPLSFGNKAYAVSLGRKSLEANRAEIASGAAPGVRYGFYIELANHLWARDWTIARRQREWKSMASSYESREDIFLKNCYYEGIVDIEAISDREEAKKILREVIQDLTFRAFLTPLEKHDLGRARTILSTWES
ncbi:MAG: hypothetical protein JW760_04070 [Spirochaetales bacterium]|nr:hypothetical protein [Spirochaetales bacterium]